MFHENSRTKFSSKTTSRNWIVSDSHQESEYEYPNDVKIIIQFIMERGPQTRKELKRIWKKSIRTLDLRLSLLKNKRILAIAKNFDDLRSPFYCFTSSFEIWSKNLNQFRSLSILGDVAG